MEISNFVHMIFMKQYQSQNPDSRLDNSHQPARCSGQFDMFFMFAFSYFAGGWNDAGIRVLARQTGYAPDREQ